MPKQTISDSLWRDRIPAANKYYDEWSKLFKCDALEKYYEGEQWKSQRELGYNPYVINKVYETIQIKIAEFVPTFPKFLVSAKPVSQEFDFEAGLNSAQLKEDVLNTIIQDDEGHFSEEMEQCYKDHFFRFGIMEVGYAAEWILNPNAQKPLLKGQADKDVNLNQKYQVKNEPEELPMNERVYFKHIPAANFRVGGIDHKYLNQCGWCGYFEYMNKEDLMNPALKLMNREKIESAAETSTGLEFTSDKNSDKRKPGTVKIWHIWDNRAKLRLILLDSPTITIFQRKYTHFNLTDFRPDRRNRTGGFYPVPPVYHWLSPQDEINETREMLRAHRRRFVRKFAVREGFVDDEEIEKFETGPDGALIKVRGDNAIIPIENASLGQELSEAIQTSGADLNAISGTSNQEREVSDRATATETNIINQRGAVRENKDRDRIVNFYVRIARSALLIVRERFTLGIWTKLTSPEGEEFLGTVNEKATAYKWVTSEDLNDGYDFRINVDLTSMSSTARQMEKQTMLEFLATLTQFPMISFSPLLMREVAYRIGYRNDKVIKEFQKMALLMELGRQRQLMAQAGVQSDPTQQQMPQGGNAPQQLTQQMTPPHMSQIQNQLKNQMLTQ